MKATMSYEQFSAGKLYFVTESIEEMSRILSRYTDWKVKMIEMEVGFRICEETAGHCEARRIRIMRSRRDGRWELRYFQPACLY